LPHFGKWKELVLKGDVGIFPTPTVCWKTVGERNFIFGYFLQTQNVSVRSLPVGSYPNHSSSDVK
jgi:hypothetical protein